jgi:transposase
VELFEQIRREYEHGAGTIQGVARKLGVHRRMVREALANAMPRSRKTPVRERPRLDPLIPFIDAILTVDLKAPRKQRHTARRIFNRIRTELPHAQAAESTVRQYVRERKLALGLSRAEIFIPQSYPWGREAQVDWFEAMVEIDGESQKAYLFCMRSMASGGAFHRAYPHASQLAFLEAHEAAFHYFGGQFALLRYDNLKSAVQKILRGHQREETARFIGFRSHWCMFLVWIIAIVLSNTLDFEFVLSASNMLLGSGLAAFIGLVAGIIPAISASKLDPVEAIRSGM